MGRKPTPVTAPAQAPKMNEAAFEVLAQNNNELALMQAQHESAVRAVATQIGYQLPADATDPDLIQRDIASNMRRSVEACLEVGRGLAVLKTACGHGNFIARLDVLGIDRKVAAKFTQAAAKFSNVSSTRHLTSAIGNQTKLFEMLVLDDEQLEELELTGQTGELKLDDVATMSVKELRHALREAKLNAEAAEEQIAAKDTKINDLSKKLSKNKLAGAPIDWPEEFKGITGYTDQQRHELQKALVTFDQQRIFVLGLEPESPAGEAMLVEAKKAYFLALEDALARIRQALEMAEEGCIATRDLFIPD